MPDNTAWLAAVYGGMRETQKEAFRQAIERKKLELFQQQQEQEWAQIQQELAERKKAREQVRLTDIAGKSTPKTKEAPIEQPVIKQQPKQAVQTQIKQPIPTPEEKVTKALGRNTQEIEQDLGSVEQDYNDLNTFETQANKEMNRQGITPEERDRIMAMLDEIGKMKQATRQKYNNLLKEKETAPTITDQFAGIQAKVDAQKAQEMEALEKRKKTAETIIKENEASVKPQTPAEKMQEWKEKQDYLQKNRIELEDKRETVRKQLVMYSQKAKLTAEEKEMKEKLFKNDYTYAKELARVEYNTKIASLNIEIDAIENQYAYKTDPASTQAKTEALNQKELERKRIYDDYQAAISVPFEKYKKAMEDNIKTTAKEQEKVNEGLDEVSQIDNAVKQAFPEAENETITVESDNELVAAQDNINRIKDGSRRKLLQNYWDSLTPEQKVKEAGRVKNLR